MYLFLQGRFMKKYFYTLICLLTFFALSADQPTCADQPIDPPPYSLVKTLPFDDHGWFVNQHQLKKMIANNKVETVIEVGSWLGKSSRFIASQLPEKGKLYCVDTWQGTILSNGHRMKSQRLTTLYQQFLSNIKHANLTHKIIPIRMESMEAANALDIMADLIYIDAAHDTQSVMKDIYGWYPHLKQGGVMTGDDWHWKTVQIAVRECAETLKKKVCYEDNFWWYEERK